MSAISGLSQMPADGAATAGAAGKRGRASEDKSAFGAVMDDVGAPKADSDTSRIAKPRDGQPEGTGKSATRPLHVGATVAKGDEPRLAGRQVSQGAGEAGDGQSKADRKAAKGDGANDKRQHTEVGAGDNVGAATAVPVLPTIAGAKATDKPKNPDGQSLRPVVKEAAARNDQTADDKIVPLRVPMPQQTAKPADTGDIALRVVGSFATKPVAVASGEKQAAATGATPAARTVTATVVQTETHLAAPTGPAPHEQGDPVADADRKDHGIALDPHDAKSRSVSDTLPSTQVDATEMRHRAAGAKSETGDSTPDGKGRAVPASGAAGTPAPAIGAGAPLSASVANNVVSALKGPSQAAPQMAVATPQMAMSPTTPVQAMTVRLDLPEHGRIDVRVAARGNDVSLHLTAEREETVRKLAREHDAVVASLRDAGYHADIRAIATQRAPDAGSAQQQLSSAPNNGGAASGQSGTNGSPSGSHQAYRDDRDQRPAQREPHANHSPDDRRAGGIYV